MNQPRHPISQAVLELRKAMGMTQTTFAIKVLKMAVSTVARFETSTPPRGDVLIKLAAIAHDCYTREQWTQFSQLRNTFRDAYIAEVQQKLALIEKR